MARALLIIDFQNDFTPGGALAVPDGDTIAAEDQRARRAPATTTSSSPPATGTPPTTAPSRRRAAPWPVHCVAGHAGRAAAPRPRPHARSTSIVDKGQAVDTDGYSGFEGTDLEELLRERGITQVTVVGLATDYCVKNTALDALRAGFQVTVDSTAARGVEVEPGDSEPRWPRCAPPAA